jgi:hypothetical protein
VIDDIAIESKWIAAKNREQQPTDNEGTDNWDQRVCHTSAHSFEPTFGLRLVFD